ncbi:hypothetical protein PybrP1_000616 [[Pythium] brassicae (nom. inval.)]|nr:hypothetical protein PybrP1_000616 [[Pythium] brassicae (nom. inval.)]
MSLRIDSVAMKSEFAFEVSPLQQQPSASTASPAKDETQDADMGGSDDDDENGSTALMRMHYGHRISEESLVQERLRSLAAQVEDASSSSTSLYTPTSAASRRAASSLREKQRATSGESLLALLTEKKPVKSRRTPSKNVRSKTATGPRTPTTTEPLAGSSTFLPLSALSPVGAAITTPAMIGYNIMDLSPELEILDDLSEAPSLEECAEMLYDLLCC